MEPELIEAILKGRTALNSVCRVVNVQCEPAVPKGENYLSVIKRVYAKVLHGDGRKSTKSFILKEVPTEEQKQRMIVEMGVFKTEINIYTTVLKQMEALMEEYNDTENVLWGRLLHHKLNSRLLLEDLKPEGFQLRPRQACLDLEHSHLVLYSLGRYHAMAKVLEHLGIVYPKDYQVYSFVENKHIIKVLLHCGLMKMIDAMQESWGPKWNKVAQNLKMPLETMQAKLFEMGKEDDTRFNVLNHGDCWSNNLLFKYDWKNRPTEVRFIDFQLSHYNSPCWDVTYFMFTSINPPVRREHYDDLLKTYTNGLQNTLSLFRYPGRTPTFNEIASEMDRLSFFRLIILTSFHAIMTADTSETIDFEQVLMTGGECGHFIEIYSDHVYQKRIGPDLIQLIEQGVIGS